MNATATAWKIGDLVTVDSRLYPAEFHYVTFRITKTPRGARGVNYTAEPLDTGRSVVGPAYAFRVADEVSAPRTIPTYVLPFPLAPAKITRDPDGTHSLRFDFLPTPELDRLDGYGWGGLSRPLAERLRRAVEAGVVLKDGGRYTDVGGKRGVHVYSVVGRTLSTDLARLGF